MNWNKFFNDFADKYYSVPDFTNEEHVYALQNYLIEQGMLTEDIDYAIKTLLFEAPKKQIDFVQENITNAMQSAVKLSIPLLVDIGFGNNWNESH